MCDSQVAEWAGNDENIARSPNELHTALILLKLKRGKQHSRMLIYVDNLLSVSIHRLFWFKTTTWRILHRSSPERVESFTHSPCGRDGLYRIPRVFIAVVLGSDRVIQSGGTGPVPQVRDIVLKAAPAGI